MQLVMYSIMKYNNILKPQWLDSDEVSYWQNLAFLSRSFFFQRWKIGRDHPAATGGHSMPFPCGLCDSSRIQEVAEHGPWRRPQGAGDASATDWVNEIQRDPRDPRAKPGLCKRSWYPARKNLDVSWYVTNCEPKPGAGNGMKWGHGDRKAMPGCAFQTQLELLWLILNSKGKKCRFGFNS